MKSLFVVLVVLAGFQIGHAQADRCSCLTINNWEVEFKTPAKASVVNAYAEPLEKGHVVWSLSQGKILTGNDTSTITFEPIGDPSGKYVISAKVTGPDGCKVTLNDDAYIRTIPYIVEGWIPPNRLKASIDMVITQLNRTENRDVSVVLEITFAHNTGRKSKVSSIKRLIGWLRTRDVDAKRVLVYFRPDNVEKYQTWRLLPEDRPECRDIDMTKVTRADKLSKQLPKLFQ